MNKNDSGRTRPTLTPHLVIKDAGKAMDFYKAAFGAEEMMRMPTQDGRLMHGAMKIGDSMIMLADEFPEWDACSKSPLTLGGTPVTLHLQVADVDALTKRAIAAGATVKMPVQDMFWGDRYGVVTDPFGHSWSIATTIKEMSPQEMQAAAQQAMGGCQ